MQGVYCANSQTRKMLTLIQIRFVKRKWSFFSFFSGNQGNFIRESDFEMRKYHFYRLGNRFML